MDNEDALVSPWLTVGGQLSFIDWAVQNWRVRQMICTLHKVYCLWKVLSPISDDVCTPDIFDLCIPIFIYSFICFTSVCPCGTFFGD